MASGLRGAGGVTSKSWQQSPYRPKNARRETQHRESTRTAAAKPKRRMSAAAKGQSSRRLPGPGGGRRGCDLATKLHDEGLISDSDFSAAKFAVEVLQAEAKGDTAEAPRARLRQAELDLSRADDLRSKNLISHTEYDKAVRKVATLRAATGQ